jgi:hypothetical protein
MWILASGPIWGIWGTKPLAPILNNNKWNNLVIIHSDNYTKNLHTIFFTHNVVMMIIVVELDECRVIHIDCYKHNLTNIVGMNVVGPSILIAMNKFVKLLNNKLMGEWHRNCVTLACDDANCFLQSRPPEWEALHNVRHSQDGMGGGRPRLL